MRNIRYYRPTSLGEASELLLREPDTSVVLAGGTDLLVKLTRRESAVESVIDLKRVKDLSGGIAAQEDGLEIGALAQLREVVDSPVVRTRFPALREAASVMGSTQIRNRGTLVGNICNASPAADTAPPLLAYGARVSIYGARGRREVALDAFFRGPGKTVLEAGEIVEGVRVPYPGDRAGSAFERLSRRRGLDLASVSVACLVRESGRARFGLGAVGPTPTVVEAEGEDFDGLAALTQPISDLRAGREYRRAMVAVLSRRAAARARERMGRA